MQQQPEPSEDQLKNNHSSELNRTASQSTPVSTFVLCLSQKRFLIANSHA
jgi:hypothetical protein